MSRAQRLTFLGIAVVIAVVAVIVLTQTGSDDSEPTAASPTATSTPTSEPQEASPGEETPTPTATPRPRPPIPTLRAGSEREIEAEEGDTVRFRVVSSTSEEIHVHGYDLTEEVGPGQPARFSFKADITGIFEIEFHGSGEVIGSLKVEP
jgi:FtsP/CotA-like multicopper oxidase with cupredoxin domain